MLRIINVADMRDQEQAIPSSQNQSNTIAAAGPSDTPARPPITLRSTFKRHPHKFYYLGRVFRGVLPERAGDKAPKLADQAFITFDCFGKPVISKPRILIVVEQHPYFCIVVPVTTYDHRGLTKKLVIASQHAFVYTKHNGQAWSREDERRAPDMLPEFIEVVSDDPKDELLELCEGSMIDFGRPSTVHHNQETESFGNVINHHLSNLLQYFQAARAGPLTITQSLIPPLTLAPATQQTTYSRLSALLEGPRASIHKYISNNGGIEDEKDPGQLPGSQR